jgi:hypothetical protein
MDVTLALRISNAIAIVMLFSTGYIFGRLSGRHPLWVGLSMVILGLLLVSAAIALEDDLALACRRVGAHPRSLPAKPRWPRPTTKRVVVILGVDLCLFRAVRRRLRAAFLHSRS